MRKLNRTSDQWIREQFDALEAMIKADGAVFNLPLMLRTAEYHSGNKRIEGDMRICLLAIASLTPEAGGPCSVSTDIVAQRMLSLGTFFAFVGAIGSRRIALAMGLPEDGLS